MKMTYTEQLKHPNWQRKRLEMLNGANFECTNCGDKDSMLHVHHKQYFKGRMAWEYSEIELEVLCQACHKKTHEHQDALKEILAMTNGGENAALVAGFRHLNDWIDSEVMASAKRADPLGYASGLVAYVAHSLGDIDKILDVARYAVSLHGEHSEARMVFEHDRGDVFGESV